MKNIVVLGGGVVGWFAAALIQKRHPDLKVTLIESPNVPILGVGESTVPQLGELLQWLDVDENTWMKATHGIHKLGNHFVGWNTERPMTHVTDHWNASSDEYHFYTFKLGCFLCSKRLLSAVYKKRCYRKTARKYWPINYCFNDVS